LKRLAEFERTPRDCFQLLNYRDRRHGIRPGSMPAGELGGARKPAAVNRRGLRGRSEEGGCAAAGKVGVGRLMVTLIALDVRSLSVQCTS